MGARRRWKRACKNPECESKVPESFPHWSPRSNILEVSSSHQSPTGYSPATATPSQIISSTIGPSQVTPPTTHLSEPHSSASAAVADGNGSDINTFHLSTVTPLGDVEDEFWAQASACMVESQLMDTTIPCVTESQLVNAGTVEQIRACVTESNTGRVHVVKKQATLFSFMVVKPSTKKSNSPPIATSGGSFGRARKQAGKITASGVERKMNSTKRSGGNSTRTCPFYKWIPGN